MQTPTTYRGPIGRGPPRRSHGRSRQLRVTAGVISTMTTLTRFRRSFAAALMLTVLLTAAPLISSVAAANTGHGTTSGGTTADRTTARTLPRRICDIDWKRSPFQLKRLIRCAARRWDVAGGPDKAVAVARCESRLNPRAYNPGGYAGVFQQATRYWPSRATNYGFPDYSVYNGRANVMVSVRMAHRGGWGPWSCG
jgi:hypothetical protein